MTVPKRGIAFFHPCREFGTGLPNQTKATAIHEFLELGGFPDGLKCCGKLGGCLIRHAFGARHAAPCGHFPVRTCRFLQSRNIRKGAKTLFAHHGEGFDLAGFDQCSGFDNRACDNINTARNQLLQAGSSTFGRHPWGRISRGTGIVQHTCKGEVPDATLAGARSLVLAGIGLDRLDQIACGVPFAVCAHLNARCIVVVKGDGCVILMPSVPSDLPNASCRFPR